MATMRTGAATSGHDIWQAVLTSGVAAFLAFAEFPAELDHCDFTAAGVTFFFLWCTHIFLFVCGI